MKRILVTEAQLRKIMLNEFTTYLPNKGESMKPEFNSGEEVMTNPVGDQATVLDKVAKQRQSSNHLMRRVGGSLRECEKKTLDEANQDLVGRGKSFNVGMKTGQMIDSAAKADSGDKLMQNMSSENGATSSAMYMRRKRIMDMKENDPERYNRIGGKQIVRDITNTLKNAKDLSRSSKEVKKAAGIENAFQKAGGTKQSGNGMAHTKKNGGQAVNVTYER